MACWALITRFHTPLKSLAVQEHARQVAGEISDDFDLAFPGLGAEEVQDGEPPRSGRSVEFQPPHPGEIRKSLSRSCNRWHSRSTTAISAVPADPRGFAAPKVLGQQLDIQSDRRERILDLVRQAAGQLGNLGVLVDELLIDGVRRHKNQENANDG